MAPRSPSGLTRPVPVSPRADRGPGDALGGARHQGHTLGAAMNDRSTREHRRVGRTRFRRCCGRLGGRPTVGKKRGRRKHSVNRGFNAFCGRGARSRPELVWDRDEPGAWGWSVLRGFAGLAQRLPPVGQQLFDPTRRVRTDPAEHVAEVRLRVDPGGFPKSVRPRLPQPVLQTRVVTTAA